MKRLLLAHRGIHGADSLYENSLTSLGNVRNYLESYGNIGIEFDVQMLKDGTIVCYHDETLARVHKQDKQLSTLSCDDIRAFGIPQLSEIFDMICPMNVVFMNIEVKTHGLVDQDMNVFSVKLMELLLKYKLKDNFIVTSFDEKFLKIFLLLTTKMREAGTPIVQVGYNTDVIIDWLSVYDLAGITHLIVSKENLLDAINSAIYKDKKLGLMSYTFFQKQELDSGDRDVELMYQISDRPDIVIITDDIERSIKLELP